MFCTLWFSGVSCSEWTVPIPSMFPTQFPTMPHIWPSQCLVENNCLLPKEETCNKCTFYCRTANFAVLRVLYSSISNSLFHVDILLIEYYESYVFSNSVCLCGLCGSLLWLFVSYHYVFNRWNQALCNWDLFCFCDLSFSSSSICFHAVATFSMD